MLPPLYLSELISWLKTDTLWTVFDKFKLCVWLAAWVYTTVAVILLLVTASGSIAGLYALNYLALLMLKPRIVSNHAFYWRNPNGKS